MKIDIFRKVNNDKGSFALVLLVFIVLFILGVSLLEISFSETRNSSWQSNRVQAHYIARSGVYVAIEELQQQLHENEYIGSIQEIADNLNLEFGATQHPVSDIGHYTMNFSVSNLNELIITSIGTTALAEPNAKNKVTFTKKLIKGTEYGFEDASKVWFHTNNFSFKPSVDPDDLSNQPSTESFLGSSALLQADRKVILNPSVSSPAYVSKFRASVLAIGEYEGESIDASSNSYAIFDAEIIFFNGTINVKNNSSLTLTASEAVLLQKTPKYNPDYPNPNTPWSLSDLNFDDENEEDIPVGFESDERYSAYVGPQEEVRGMHNFTSGINYGVVRIKRIDSGNSIVLQPQSSSYSKGYYYFPSGVRLDRAEGRNDLIPILNSDPITSKLDEFFKWNYTETGMEIWNNE